MKKDPVSPESIARLSAKFKELDPSALDLMVRLLLTAADTERLMEKHFGEYGLTQGRFSALMMLFHAPGHRAKPIDIADHLGVTRGNMTGILDNLERDGLILRSEDDDDRRINYVSLTTKGKKHLDKMLPTHLKRTAQLVVGLNENDRHKMVKLLDTIRAEVKKLMTSVTSEVD